MFEIIEKIIADREDYVAPELMSELFLSGHFTATGGASTHPWFYVTNCWWVDEYGERWTPAFMPWPSQGCLRWMIASTVSPDLKQRGKYSFIKKENRYVE